MSNKNFLIFLFILLKYGDALKLPPYFNQCSKTDPKVNECVTHNANGGLRAFVKGDKDYNIQSLLPLFIPHISLQVDKNLRINLINSVVSELQGAKVKDAKIELNNKHIELAMYMPRATLLGQYNIKGKISILPIDEKGPVNITVVHSRIKYSFNYELLERKGKHYMNITESAMTYKSERCYFMFYNLFPDNDFLGGVINDSLNEHWVETNREVAPAVSDALCKITTDSLRGFFEKMPYEELFTE